MSDTVLLSVSDAEALLVQALLANGAPDAVARSVARGLVAAEAEGQVGHGFSRLGDYVAQMRSGKLRADAVPQVSVAGAQVTVDAGNGFAFPALDAGLETGIRVADQLGAASVAVSRSHHCGALSVQVDRIAQAGMVAIMVANTPAAIAPWGATRPLFGTNPIAFAAPRRAQGQGGNLVIDLSLSVVARGKVMNARKQGKPIPEGWALDADGNPTTDPEAALAGSMVPIGGPKGTALALMVEVLAATLTGANSSAAMPSFFTADGPPPGSGQFVMILKPGAGFADRIESLLTEIAGLDGTRLPGARRAAALARAHQDGLRVPRLYVQAARDLAQPKG